MYTSLLNLVNQIVPLSTDEEILIRNSFNPLSLKKNDYFLKTGSLCKQIGFLKKGLVRYFVYREGEEATFEFTKESEFIGDYQSFSNGIVSVQNIQAIEESELLVINYTDLQHLFNTINAGNRLGRVLIEHRFNVMVNQLLSINMHSPEERYKHFIENYSDIAQRIPQYLIASYIGIKPQSLSRMRNRR